MALPSSQFVRITFVSHSIILQESTDSQLKTTMLKSKLMYIKSVGAVNMVIV